MAEGGKAISRETRRPTPARGFDPFYEMERMMESMMPGGWLRPLRDRGMFPELAGGVEARLPSVDIIDRENEIVVRCEMPGVKKEDLEVSTDDNSVTIKGSSSYKSEDEKGDFYRCEIGGGSFARSIALPSDVDGEKARAELKNGVLELTLPKKETTKRHSISVQ